MDRKQVGILVFEDVEVLDFCGPFEVFSATRLDEDKRREEPSPFNVFLVAEKKKPVVASGGLKVLPDYDLRDCPALSILVVPGGWGTRKEMNNTQILKWIIDRSRHLEIHDFGMHGLIDTRPRRSTRRQACHHPLAFPRLDAGAVSEDRRRKKASCGRRREPHHFRGNFGGHRHGAQSGLALLWRGGRQGHRQTHGVPLPRKQCPPYFFALT